MLLIERSLAAPVETNEIFDLEVDSDNYSVTIIHNYAENSFSQTTDKLLLAILSQLIHAQNFGLNGNSAINPENKTESLSNF